MIYEPRWNVEGRDWPNRGHSRFVDAGGLRWHVQTIESSRADAPALLLIHGTGAATHSWRALAPMLAADFAVTAIDLPGHGFTRGVPVGGVGIEGMARGIGDLLRVLDLRPWAIVGHSAGAAVAVRMAIDGIAAPAAIVGLGAALMPFRGLAAQLFPTLARMIFVNPFAPHILSRMARSRGETARFLTRSTGSRIDAAGVAGYAALLATPGHVAGAIAMMASWDLERLRDDLPRLTARLLLVHGGADSAIPVAQARAAAALVPGAQVTVLPGLGHLAHEEAPERVAVLVRDFVGGG